MIYSQTKIKTKTMKINRANFFTEARKNFGKFNQSQVDGFNSILDEWELTKYTDKRWLAYMLATAWHETDATMQPIEEYGKGKTKTYGKKIKHSGVSYSMPDVIFYGRGLVQLTWYENYELMGKLLKVDLLKRPELALLMEVSVKIMFEGMLRGSSSFGDFTGKCLEMYFNNKTDDPINARRIINGTDKADLIAGYYNKFLRALL
jgi:putative chitinase